MRVFQRARVWWQRLTGDEETPLDGDTPAWMVSMAIHVAALLGLSLYVVTRERVVTPPIEVSLRAEPEPDPDLDEPVVAIDPSAPDTRDAAVAPPAPDVADVPEPLPVVLPEFGEIAVAPPAPPAAGSPDLTAPAPVPAKPNGEGSLAVDGEADALDYIAGVIRQSVLQHDTTVCWVFDRSVSLAGQRRQIAARLANVFGQLDATLADTVHLDLRHEVFAYGDAVTRLTREPSPHARVVEDAILSIPVDESGVENTFTAIRQAVETTTRKPGDPPRSVMILVFTDEVGNDQEKADDVARLCQKRLVPVYVVGVPAPFGRVKVPIRFVEYDTDRYEGGDQWPEVDQGPETRYPEFVRLLADEVDDEPMDSGFGPFSLSKLCGLTGGRYLCLHANRAAPGTVVEETAPMASRLRHFFDPVVMRDYRPLYAFQAQIDAEIAKNPAKRALVAAAAKELSLAPLRSRRWVFPKESEAAFKTLLDDAQQTVIALERRVEELLRVLQAGGTGRAALREKRWQAGYDLALGQALAATVRLKAYNQILADAKLGRRFTDPRNNTWKLVPAPAVAGPNAKLATQATTLLERVVNEHAGTPWALIAARDLATPLGYRWEETFTDLSPRRPGPQPNPPPRPPDDPAPRMLAPPKGPRPLKNL